MMGGGGGVRSLGGLLCWKKSLGKMREFVMSKDEDTLKVAPMIPIWNKDRFIATKKNVRVPQYSWSNMMRRMKMRKK